MKFLRTLCWAVYLGCSWTWCIGMFLPVILVSWYGNAAWFVFAIPNVIGAAAMGWTLAKPGSSRKMVAEHQTACVAFSVITITFHLFFLYWLCAVRPIPLIPPLWAVAAVAGGFLIGLIGRRWIGVDFLLAFVALGVSLVVMAKGLQHPVWGVANPLQTEGVSSQLIGLSAVSLLGFALCPYLDLTFHRARQQTDPTAGKFAFGIGFGVVFLSMIMLTMLYANDFAFDKTTADSYGSFGGRLLITWVALHLCTQAGFTISAHCRVLPRLNVPHLILWTIAGVLLWATIFAIRQEVWFNVKQVRLNMLSGELMYRLFMSFYGLIFPAYVWICMVPIRGRSSGPSSRALMVTAVAVVIATPFFWLGFVCNWMLWLIPGVAVVLLARLLVPGNAQLEPRTK